MDILLRCSRPSRRSDCTAASRHFNAIDVCPDLMGSTPFDLSQRFYSHSPFAPRQKASSIEKSITTRVILSQILSYPSMMAKGGCLPPFIFPPCAAEGIEATEKCCAKGLHRCLSRLLAICNSLIQSFGLGYQEMPHSSGKVYTPRQPGSTRR